MKFSLKTLLLFVVAVSGAIAFQQAVGWLALVFAVCGFAILSTLGRWEWRVSRWGLGALAVLLLWTAAVDFRYSESRLSPGSDDFVLVLEVRVLAVPVWSRVHLQGYAEEEQTGQMPTGERVFYARLHGLFLPNPDMRLSRGIRSLT